jgi:L-threonylcarbamoyladenylate synthase
MSVLLPADDPNSALVAAEMLRRGKLVVIPTDTGYGLAAPLTDEAILRMYLVKSRPPDKSIPVMIGRHDDLELVAQPLMPAVRRLIEQFWPGPLTLLVPKANGLPQRVSALPTVAVRMPRQESACAVARAAGGALVVAKASISEQAVPHSAQDAIKLFGDDIAAVIDGGDFETDQPSTVAEVDGRTLRIVRQGPISEDALKAVLQA